MTSDAVTGNEETRDEPSRTTTAARGSGRVVVVGSINVDLFARVARHPRPGETVLGGDGSTRPGGKGANQAVAAALAGADVAMVGCVGDDAQARVGLSLLRRAGVDLGRVREVADTPTGLALITVADSGENSIIVVPGANHALTMEDVADLGLTTGDVVVLQGEIPVDVVDETARRAVAAGARVCLNLAPVVDLAADTLRAADPLVVNEHEALAAAGLLGVDAGGHEEESIDAVAATSLAEALVGAGVRSVVVTLGGAGAVVALEGAESFTCTGERVEVVDTTGAGDCFAGTLAARLALGDDLGAAAAVGNRAAAKAVQGHGAQESYDWEGRS
ncbi:ribokinase [Mobilicoccus sp.]|uniref:ribokinase n=1 Tax=Mobilicoccus sp. TaxID=2034349 RepID=UPI0028AD8783|nr:ribokinase [Mobilicoccus sp.]